MANIYIPYERNSINKKLKSLYLPCYIRYIEFERYSETAYPYLLAVSANYLKAKYRIMVFGKETNTWGDEMTMDAPADLCVEDLMEIYNTNLIKDDYNKQFWNFNRFLRNLLSKQVDYPVGWIYNNIVKIGKAATVGCDNGINMWAVKNFNVIKSEIDILKPNLLIFMTGPKYDDKIEAVLGKFNGEFINEGASFDFKRIAFKDETLPTAFKCYHPGGLQRCKGLYHSAACILTRMISNEMN